MKKSSIIPFLLLCVLLLGAGSAGAKTTFNITVLSDLGESRSTELKSLYLKELQSLTQGEFKLNIREVNIDWLADPQQQINTLYKDPAMDMLLVLGFAANQLMITREQFTKPTFLPFVIESEMVGAPIRDGVSGKKNLNYLTYSLSFLDAIARLREVVAFDNIAVIADRLVLQSIPPNISTVMEARFEGMQIQLISTDGDTGDVLPLLPANVDAVIVGLVPRLSDAQLDRFIAGMIERKLPSFTYLGTSLVHRGVLATPTNDSLLMTAARRNALNMQAVMLGEPAESLPVLIEARSKLTINQATAEKIGVAINFKTLINSEVIGFGEGLESSVFDLVSLTQTSLQNNLQIKNEGYNLAIQENAQSLARGSLLPQLSAGASQLVRKDGTLAVQSGLFPEQSTDVVLNLSQTLFSDSEWANYKIQQLLFQASTEQFRETQLDVVRETALAMADVLQARSEAAVQQGNLSFSEKSLELAQDRVSLGASSSADKYRWQTQVANGKSAVFQSYSNVLVAEQNLNRILNREIQSPIKLTPFDLDNLTIFTVQKLFELMENVDSFEKLYNIGLLGAYDQSPEIKGLDALVLAKQREIKTLARQRWLPDFSISGQLSDNVDQIGLQVDEGAGSDWQVMLNAQVPLYAGGQISAQKKQGKLELAQLHNQLALSKQQIAQTLRSSMNNLLTSLFNVDFSTDAARAATLSLGLVTDSYSQGAVSIVDLLDAQTSSVNANLAKIQANIDLFRAGIDMQRTIGEFEFLLSEEQKSLIREQFEASIKSGTYQTLPAQESINE